MFADDVRGRLACGEAETKATTILESHDHRLVDRHVFRGHENFRRSSIGCTRHSKGLAPLGGP